MNHETLSDLASLATLACFFIEAARAAWDAAQVVRKSMRKRMGQEERPGSKGPENE